MREALLGVDLLAASDMVMIAYKPIWAIGTGRAATADGVNTLIRNVIHSTIAGMFGIDGALVGGASLDALVFTAIVKAAGG